MQTAATVDPKSALLIFFSAVALLILAFRLYRSTWFVNSFRKSKRAHIEDILKLLYHMESRNQHATLATLSGALMIPERKWISIVEEMTAENLIRLADHSLTLTDAGKEYALHIIRGHRLWEKHLSEKTGFDKKEWHRLAEQKEHALSREEADRLSRDLGDPRFDPHGDPIPTEVGELQEPEWLFLSSLKKGDRARIVHIEDEPKAIYDQILANKLHIGSRLVVGDSTEREIRFASEGQEYVLSPIVAGNIHVDKLSDEDILEENSVRLSSLQPGETATVVGISSECRGANRRRLLDLGFVRGSKVELEFESPMKEPRAYTIRNTLIALRDTQSDLILIEKTS